LVSTLGAGCGASATATPTAAPAATEVATSAATEAATEAAAPAYEPMKIKVASDATWAPFEFVDENKDIVGFDIDLMNEIASEVNLEVEYVNTAWDGIFAGLDSGKYDAVISSVTITDERKQTMDFTDPYYEAGQIIAVRSDETAITGKDSLAGKTVGAQIGTTGAMEAQAMTDVELKQYDTIDLAFQDLMSTKIDAVIVDSPVLLNQLKVMKGKVKGVGDVFTTEPYGITVKKGNTELVERLNAGLKKVKDAGKIEEIEATWRKWAEE
jgi:polar amino acid transport system substrate-binding protein